MFEDAKIEDHSNQLHTQAAKQFKVLGPIARVASSRSLGQQGGRYISINKNFVELVMMQASVYPGGARGSRLRMVALLAPSWS